MQPTIRKAVAEDDRVIKRVLFLAHCENTRLGYLFPIASIRRSRLREKINRDLYYVLELEGRIVGTVAIRKREREWEIGSLAIIPAYRKQGWGKRLLRYAEKKIKKLGGRRAILFTIKNHPTLPSYYKKRGYHPLKKKAFIKGKWIIFTKNLS